MHALAPEEQEIIRQHILVAAMGRFRHYGYNKTTMVEIARDVGMSAGNLYRYYGNKQDIAIACCLQVLDAQLQSIRKALDKCVSGREKLRLFISEVLEHKLRYQTSQAKLHELVNIIMNERPRPVLDNLEQHQSLLEDVLVHGVRRGEFRLADVPGTAGLMLAMMESLQTDSFMIFFPGMKFTDKIGAIADLLIESVAGARPQV